MMVGGLISEAFPGPRLLESTRKHQKSPFFEFWELGRQSQEKLAEGERERCAKPDQNRSKIGPSFDLGLVKDSRGPTIASNR
jgi:hypothetical protein